MPFAMAISLPIHSLILPADRSAYLTGVYLFLFLFNHIHQDTIN